MKLQRIKQAGIIFVFIGLIIIQAPGSAQTGWIDLLPQVTKTWIQYFPIIGNAPSITPIPTTTPLPNGTPPPFSSSYYLLTVDGNKMYNLGCQLGTVDRNMGGSRDTIVILDFGSPKLVNSEFGTDLFYMGPVTNTQIKAAVQNFGRGYYVCVSTDRNSQIYVAVGTTNYGSLMASSTATARALGVAWSQMVNDINTWLKSNGFSGQVHVVGANDIEPAWSSAAAVRAWVTATIRWINTPIMTLAPLTAVRRVRTRREPPVLPAGRARMCGIRPTEPHRVFRSQKSTTPGE